MSDTIAAIATGAQVAAIGIIRISGPKSLPIVDRLFHPASGKLMSGYEDRKLVYGRLTDRGGELLLRSDESGRSYAADETLRKATLHLLGDRYGWSTKYPGRPIETKPHTVSRFLLTQTDADDRMTPKFFQTLDAARHEMVEAVAGITGDCFSKFMQAMSECFKA